MGLWLSFSIICKLSELSSFKKTITTSDHCGFGLLGMQRFLNRSSGQVVIWSEIAALTARLFKRSFFLTYSCANRSNPPISLCLSLWQKHLKVSYECSPHLSPAISIWSLCPASHSASLYSRYLPCPLRALLLEIGVLVSLNLIIRDLHFHKTQNQFRKLTLKISSI